MLSKRFSAIASESTAVSLAIESFAEIVLSLPFDPPPQAVERANNATVKIGMIFFMGDYVELSTYLLPTPRVCGSRSWERASAIDKFCYFVAFFFYYDLAF